MSSLTLWRFQTVSLVRHREKKKHVFEPFDSFDFLSLSSRKAAEKQLSDQKTMKTRVHRQNCQRLKTNFFFFFFKSTSDKRHKNTEVQVQLSWSFRQVKTITGQSSTATICSDRHSNLYQLIIQDYQGNPIQQKQLRAHRPRVGRWAAEVWRQGAPDKR